MGNKEVSTAKFKTRKGCCWLHALPKQTDDISPVVALCCCAWAEEMLEPELIFAASIRHC